MIYIGNYHHDDSFETEIVYMGDPHLIEVTGFWEGPSMLDEDGWPVPIDCDPIFEFHISYIDPTGDLTDITRNLSEYDNRELQRELYEIYKDLCAAASEAAHERSLER